MKKHHLLFLGAFFLLGPSFAQKTPVKFGKISMEELTMEKYDKDPSAEAVVLCDYGFSTLNFSQNIGWKLDFRRTCRIKIFNPDGFDWADHQIPLYDYGTIEENISGLKGITYNLEDGKIVESKLEKDNIFKEALSEKWKAVKFTMPNVKEGSVLEFTYTISSDYIFELREWQFQKSIPVVWSEYLAKIPEYFNYLQLSQGFEQFTKYDVGNEAGSLSSNGQSISYNTNTYHWIAENMPALKDESYVTNAENFFQKVSFQCASYRSPGGSYQPVLGTWEKINSEFLNSSDFGGQIKPKSFYKEVLASITANAKDQKEKAFLIYKYISENIKWDETYSYMSQSPIKKVFDEKIGRSSDINMLLISMLNAADIKTYAVITSTRHHGFVNPIHPILDKYNYLIAEAVIDGKSYLMDATAKNLQLGMLPVRALNQLGRRISDENPGWVDIDAVYADDELKYYTVQLSEDGRLQGTLQRKKSGYNALHVRNKIELDGTDKYLTTLKEGLPDWEVSNHSIENIGDIHSDITEKYDFAIDNGAMSTGNMIYLKPFFDKVEATNPFKKEIRKLPIDFVYPMHEKYIVIISLPEGFQVEELPKDILLTTPDKSGKFLFSIKKLGNQLQVTSDFVIHKSFFSAEEYGQLKEFFNIVISKSEEQIVLKKVS